MKKAVSRTATLLLIEDDKVDASRIEQALRKSKIGNPLVSVASGEEAFRLLHERSPGRPRVDPPFVILLDLALPGMSGIEFLQELRRDPVLKRAEVLVLTASERVSDEIAAGKLGVRAYIRKSRCSEDFLEFLRSFESSWSLVEQL